MINALLDACAFLLWLVVGFVLVKIAWLVFIGQLGFVSAAVAGIVVIAIAKWMDGP